MDLFIYMCSGVRGWKAGVKMFSVGGDIVFPGTSLVLLIFINIVYTQGNFMYDDII